MQEDLHYMGREYYEPKQVHTDQRVPEITRQAVVLARRGQGLFKQNVMKRGPPAG